MPNNSPISEFVLGLYLNQKWRLFLDRLPNVYKKVLVTLRDNKMTCKEISSTSLIAQSTIATTLTHLKRRKIVKRAYKTQVKVVDKNLASYLTTLDLAKELGLSNELILGRTEKELMDTSVNLITPLSLLYPNRLDPSRDALELHKQLVSQIQLFLDKKNISYESDVKSTAIS